MDNLYHFTRKVKLCQVFPCFFSCDFFFCFCWKDLPSFRLAKKKFSGYFYFLANLLKKGGFFLIFLLVSAGVIKHFLNYMRNAPRIVLRNFKSIFCKQCLPDQERLKTKIPPVGGILCFCLLGSCLHSVPVRAKQTSTGRLAPPNPCDRRFHLRRCLSSCSS